MSEQALILFAHGARDPEWANPLLAVRAAVAEGNPSLQVEVAFLEFMAPSLSDCAERLVTSGVRRIVVVPMFIAQGGHLRRDVPLLVETMRAAHPNVEFALAKPVGEADPVIKAMAVYATACLDAA